MRRDGETVARINEDLSAAEYARTACIETCVGALCRTRVNDAPKEEMRMGDKGERAGEEDALIICGGLRKWTRVEGICPGVDCDALPDDE